MLKQRNFVNGQKSAYFHFLVNFSVKDSSFLFKINIHWNMCKQMILCYFQKNKNHRRLNIYVKIAVKTK